MSTPILESRRRSARPQLRVTSLSTGRKGRTSHSLRVSSSSSSCTAAWLTHWNMWLSISPKAVNMGNDWACFHKSCRGRVKFYTTVAFALRKQTKSHRENWWLRSTPMESNGSHLFRGVSRTNKNLEDTAISRPSRCLKTPRYILFRMYIMFPWSESRPCWPTNVIAVPHLSVLFWGCAAKLYPTGLECVNQNKTKLPLPCSLALMGYICWFHNSKSFKLKRIWHSWSKISQAMVWMFQKTAS